MGLIAIETATVRSDSPDSQYNGALDDQSNGIDRHRINQDEARTRFLPRSERELYESQNGIKKRQRHRSSERRRPKYGEDIINNVNVSDDGDEDDSLERKLAWLQREVAEVRGEFDRRSQESKKDPSPQESRNISGLDSLAQALQAVNASASRANGSTAQSFIRDVDLSATSRQSTTNAATKLRDGEKEASEISSGPAHSIQSDSNLTHIADFDARLSQLEHALGVDTISLPSQNSSHSKPLLPSLERLDKQFASFSLLDETSHDALKGRVRELALETESLERRKRQAVESQGLGSARPGSSSAKEGIAADDSEQVAKINALYGTLNTIESLAPLLPSVLDRLRSLKDVHAEATSASQRLADAESRQEEICQELQAWREGLEKVESAMQESHGTMKSNTDTVETWVKDLEQRMKALD